MTALAIRTSMPQWLLHELSRQLSDDELESWAVATQVRPPLSLRVNRRRASVTDVAQQIEASSDAVVETAPLLESLLITSGAGEVPKLPGFTEGHFSIQDVGAQCVAWLADPTPGDVVLDLCSAPGGKAGHLAELMDDQGTLIAVELHERKAALIKETCDRLGLSCVRVASADASKPDTLRELLQKHVPVRHGMAAGNGEDEEGSAELLADCVVIDAPCSGTGTLRRNPEHRYRLDDPSRLAGLTALQDRLLDSAAGCVRPGGTLTFSVCSPLSVETTERVSAFLSRHPDFGRVHVGDADVLAPFAANDEDGERTCIRTWTHQHPADSHFACKLRRLADV